MKMSYKTNNNIVYSCKYHLVWCTKYRKLLLHSPIEQSFKKILLDTARSTRWDVIELKVIPDHLRILMEIDPQYGINVVVKKMKGRSSRMLRDKYSQLKALPALWTNSYLVSTVGGAPLHIVKQYIENQKHV
jgi:putative transposase